MNFEEFRNWYKDFATLFPVLSKSTNAFPKETFQAWFDTVFAEHDISDAMVASKQLLREGAIKPYDVDRIPSIYADRLSELRGRRVAHDANEETKAAAGALGSVRNEPRMAKMLSYVEERMETYKKKHGVDRTPSELVKGWSDEASTLFDKPKAETVGKR